MSATATAPREDEGTLAILAVDDERPALTDLARMLQAADPVGEVECADSGSDALRALNGRAFDAVFLDVRMPDLDGIELARVLRRFDHPPPVVFVSAYESAAVDAFEVQALDYLVKPVSRQGLERALGRVAEHLRDAGRTEAAPTPAPIPEPAMGGEVAGGSSEQVAVDVPRGGTRLLARSSILYLHAEGDYVRIVGDDGRYLLRGRISELERAWEKHGFARIHRSYIANLRRTVEIRPRLNGTAGLVLADGTELPIARRKIAALRARLGI
jgi:two-component system, LytTR family, response regulator LytT